MNENELFEDFTTVSPWERFIAKLETTIRGWDLSSESINSSSKTFKNPESSIVTYIDAQYELQYFNYKGVEKNVSNSYIDKLIDNSNFSTSAKELNLHSIAKWYGLDSFLVLQRPGGAYASESSQLLSSLSLALDAAHATIPGFVLVRSAHQHHEPIYIGYCFHNQNSFTRFDVHAQSQVPGPYSYLTGLVEGFCTNLGLATRSVDVLVSTRYTYTSVPSTPFSISWSASDEHISSSYTPPLLVRLLPFSIPLEPITSLSLHVQWPAFSSKVIWDNPVYSALNPETSPEWLLSARLEGKPALDGPFHKLPHLTSILAHLFSVISSNNRLDEFANVPYFQATQATEANDASVANTNGRSAESVQFDEEGIAICFSSQSDGAIRDGERDGKRTYFKSTNPVSLIGLMTFYLTSSDSPRAQWSRMLGELRWHWENLTPLPHTNSFNDPPNWDNSLLQQKISMLNYCISRRLKDLQDSNPGESPKTKRKASHVEQADQAAAVFQATLAREQMKEKSEKGKKPNAAEDDDDDDDEDDDDDFQTPTSTPRSTITRPTSTNFANSTFTAYDQSKEFQRIALTPIQPDDNPSGQYQPLTRLGSLLLYPNRQAFEPITQEPAVQTQDQFEEQQQLFAQLGDSKEGAEKRAFLQSRTLLSDMKAFKAANPGCIFHDFIRYWSPNDWKSYESLPPEEASEWMADLTEDDDHSMELRMKAGRLSERMYTKGNMWLVMWDKSAPEPAHSQKPLFDPLREGELVLNWLETIPGSEVYTQLLVILLEVILFRLEFTPVTSKSSYLSSRLQGTAKIIQGCLNRSDSYPTYSHQGGEAGLIVKAILDIEYLVSLGTALCYFLTPSLPEQEQLLAPLIDNLLQSYEEEEEEEEGDNIAALLSSPSTRSFVKSALFSSPKLTAITLEASHNHNNPNIGSNNSNNRLDRPDEKEFILHTSIANPIESGVAVPHRMFASLRTAGYKSFVKKSESAFKVATAISTSD